MLKLICKVLPVIACVFVAIPATANVEIPKDWPRMDHGFFSIKMNISGIEHTQNMCLTKADMQDAEKNAAKDNDCVITKAARSGQQYTVEMDCKDPQNGEPMHMRLTSTLISKSQSKTNMVATQNGKSKMSMTSNMKRMRACTEEEAVASQNRTLSLPNMTDISGQLGEVFSEETMGKLKGLMDKFEF
jgi:hypothetical protein